MYVYHTKLRPGMRAEAGEADDHSTARIRSAVGENLPRPAEFDALQQGHLVSAGVPAELPGAVQWAVDRQLGCGTNVINDGEYVKAALRNLRGL